MVASSFFSQLHSKSSQLTPYLRGYQGEVVLNAVIPQQDNQAVIEALFSQLEQDHPEAGNAYWLTRTWSLLCWQPVYLAFISVYQLKSVPPLASMVQYVSDNFISGYQFQRHTVTQGGVKALIECAGRELRALLDDYREQMATWTRIRPGFADHLLGDVVMSCLLNAHQSGELDEASLRTHCQWWLEACQLPLSLANTLFQAPISSEIIQIRKSCCLVYKCHGRGLCGNCPRHEDNKKRLSQ